LTDVASSDQHTVKPWFAGKLDFSLPVTDFASQGFPLAGGRLDRFGGRDVATLIYRRGQHVVNVFVWPEGGAASPSETQSRGYHMLEWRSGGLTYLAISDTAIDELHRLSGLLGAKN
jgi:anti-sigma factor RsiW